MLTVFPEYRGFGQGYFDVRKPQFEEFLREHGKHAIDLVRNSRLVQTALILILALLSFFLLKLLVGETPAFIAIVLAMNAPFVLGHSRLLNHEGMLSIFVLVSFLGMQVFVNKDRRLAYLLVSGAAFGLAQLTKSSSIVVLPLIGLVLFVGLFKRDGGTMRAKLWSAVKSFAIWIFAAAFVYAALWPGMWVAPGKMLYEIYGNAFSYAFQGARLDVTQELQPSGFDLDAGFSGSLQFVNYWAVASTVVTWLGLFLAAFALAAREKGAAGMPVKSTVVYLAALAALFVLIFGLAKGRDTPHYIISSFICLDVIAGIGWGWLLGAIQKRRADWDRPIVGALAVLVLGALQLGHGLPYHPYYFTYHNPLLPGAKAAEYGYGEGLDQAAAYLAQKPNAENSSVYSYAGMGCFSYLYPGNTEYLKGVYLKEKGYPTMLKEIQAADYLVWYSIEQDPRPESADFLRIMQNVQPEHVITMDGMEYARIYRIADIPASVYEEMGR